MELKNLIASLKKTIVLIWDKTTRGMFHSKKYLRFILGYFQTSETIFLLFFATLIGVGAGFGAIIFRWMITFFQNLFFTQGQHTLAFLGSYYVIIIPAIGGVIVGLIVYFFAREAKGHGVPEVMLAVAIGGSRIRPRVAAIKALVSSICIGSGGSVGREGPIFRRSLELVTLPLKKR